MPSPIRIQSEDSALETHDENGSPARKRLSRSVWCCLFVIRAAPSSRGDQRDDWPVYGHDAGGMRFSPLTQITREMLRSSK